MKLRFWADREESVRSLRREVRTLTDDLTEAEEARDYFKARYEESHRRAEAEHAAAEQATARYAEAQIVVSCLTRQVTEEKRKVTALEAIAGPYRDSADEPSPIFSAVTQEIPFNPHSGPAPATGSEPDAEVTREIAVKALAEVAR